jgi:hypothetical protein
MLEKFNNINEVLAKIVEKEDDWFKEETKTLNENISYTYSEDYSEEDEELSATLNIIWNDESYTFERTGYRNISYERWIDNTWYNWE